MFNTQLLNDALTTVAFLVGLAIAMTTPTRNATVVSASLRSCVLNM